MSWAPQLFAVLFFMMLFTLGVGSATADAGAIASIFCDKYPKLKRWWVTGVICIFGCAVGLVYVTPVRYLKRNASLRSFPNFVINFQGGQWMTDLVDFYGGGFVIYTVIHKLTTFLNSLINLCKFNF
jgi:solute carrier family 6 amino acid transporter-like protein 5/7/9/14